STPNRLRPASKGRFKRFGRCVPPRFCRVRGAVGEEKGRLKSLSSAARYVLQLGDLPPLVRDAVTGSADVGRIASFPLYHRLAALLADTIDTRLEGEMRVLQYAGRLTELVAYTLDAMQHVPLLRGTALNRQRDVDLAHAALARLERSFRRPPLFAELAREIGTNQNKLKAVFKEAFGVTMAE
ncbi:MAG: hypothetical protein ACOYO0_14760, partial [Sandarakinorhabdus sp.]